MKDQLQSIQNQIATITEIPYVDENWGQIDYYSPNHPVQWPCTLIDISEIGYSNTGMSASKSPVNRQMGNVSLIITVANLKLTNSSFRAPQGQKNDAWKIWDIMELIHKKLQGFSPTPNCKLMRTGMRKMRRDDGIQEYEVYYSFVANDV